MTRWRNSMFPRRSTRYYSPSWRALRATLSAHRRLCDDSAYCSNECFKVSCRVWGLVPDLMVLGAGSLRVMRMNEANETYRAASAIAAFDAIQVAFAALVKKGILSKAEAEQIIREAIETIKTGGAGDQAAELLAIALEKISKFEPAPRQ